MLRERMQLHALVLNFCSSVFITHADVVAGVNSACVYRSCVGVGGFVCDCAGMYVSKITKKPLDSGNIITKLGRWTVRDKSWSTVVFGGDPVSFVDPGSFSMILFHQEIGRKLTFCSPSQQVTNAFRRNFLEVWVVAQGAID